MAEKSDFPRMMKMMMIVMITHLDVAADGVFVSRLFGFVQKPKKNQAEQNLCAMQNQLQMAMQKADPWPEFLDFW